MALRQLTNLIFEPKGKHDPTLTYNITDVVMSEDGSRAYFALQDVPVGIQLSDEDYWMLQIDLSGMPPGGGGTGGGADGEDGGYYKPNLGNDGYLGWIPSKSDMPEVEGANVKGPKGESGVYVGSEEPGADYDVWIDPNGEASPPSGGGGITAETDPTVPAWAKEPTKPRYTAAEVGARPDDWLPSPSEIGAQPAGNYALKNEIPDTSAFITRAVSDLENYYSKNQTYSQEEIDQRISAIPKFSISVVSALPSTGISTTTIYLVPGGADDNLYTEYINVNGTWEILGSQRVDLTGYATQSWTLERLAEYQPKGNYQPAGDYALKNELPAVPTNVSAFTNDAGYLTEHQDISGKLDADKLPAAVNSALAQAKASGEFDGKDGSDYILTPVDKVEIAEQVDGATIVQAPMYVDSVEKMTDTSRVYVLAETGRIWAYMEKTEQRTVTEKIEGTADNPFRDNYRIGSDGSFQSLDGYVVTPYIDIGKYEQYGSAELKLGGVQYIFPSHTSNVRVLVLDENKNKIACAESCIDGTYGLGGVLGFTIDPDGKTARATFNIPYKYQGGTVVKYLVFCTIGTAATSDITISYTALVTSAEWYDTGTTYAPSLTEEDKRSIADDVAAMVDAQLLTVVGDGVVTV